MPNSQKHCKIFADYFQFYLWHHGDKPEPPTDYIAEDSKVRMKVAKHIVVVLPERNMTVPVSLEVLKSPPELDLENVDHMAEASLELSSGMLEIHECTGGSLDILSVDPGTYRVRVSFLGLNTLSEDGLDGDDHYTIAIWPTPYAPLSVLKQFEG